MNYYWYFWLGFSAVGLLWLPSFVRLVRKAHKLSSWKETYRKECENEEGSELKTIKDIDDFYDEKKSQSYLGRKFLLEKKAYLLSKINEVEQKKEFAKDMIPLLVQSILPEIISLFFLGINAEKLPNYAFIVAIVVLALYLIAVFFFSFKLLSLILSPKTADVVKDEYELRCIDRLINEHFENLYKVASTTT